MFSFKYKFYTALATIAISLTACDNLFDDAPNDKISDNKVWQNNQLLDEYVNGWYRNMSDGFKTLVPSNALLKGMSRYYMPWFTDQLSVGKADWLNAGYGDILQGNQETITNWAKSLWTKDYSQLQYINSFLANADKVTNAERRKRIEGEAHFFRGYYYYMLWRQFGGVLLIDHPFDPLNHPEQFPRASYRQMVDFIVAEADKAAESLPEKHEKTQAGRVTKVAALMLKAKTYLWASSPVYQNKTQEYLGFKDDQSKAMLQKAKQVYEQLLALNAVSLVPIDANTEEDIAKAYRKIFLTKNSQESILELQHADDGNYATNFGHKLDRDAAPPSATGTVAAYTPTQNHVDEYGMRAGATYDRANPYANRDYRFYANIVYNGAMFRGKKIDVATTDGKKGVDLKPYGTSESAAATRTGYYLGKFVDEDQTIDYNDTYASKQNYIIWRLAEAMLDYAEVCYRLGDEGTALKMVNAIRQRAHMDQHSHITWQRIVNERRVELAFEETTYWDLFRWGIAEERLNGKQTPLKKMVITVKGGKTKYKVENCNRFPGRVRKFQSMQYYLPIPWSEIKYHHIAQNPQWSEV